MYNTYIYLSKNIYKKKGEDEKEAIDEKGKTVIVDEYYLLRIVKFRLKMKGNVQKYCGKNKQENTYIHARIFTETNEKTKKNERNKKIKQIRETTTRTRMNE